MFTTEMQRKLPMWVTWSRIVISPAIFVGAYVSAPWGGLLAAVLFVLGSITDYFDGYFARKFKVESDEGRLMDPIADKILVLSALVVLLYLKRVDPIMVALLLARDILIGGIRSVAAARQIIIAAHPYGKWKTAFQMVAIPCLLIHEPIAGLPLAEFGYYGLWLSVGLSLVSGFRYTKGYYQKVKAK